jgi:hypothetical protein
MRDDLMAVFQLDPKCRVWQEFLNDAGKFEQFFLGHGLSLVSHTPQERAANMWGLMGWNQDENNA